MAISPTTAQGQLGQQPLFYPTNFAQGRLYLSHQTSYTIRVGGIRNSHYVSYRVAVGPLVGQGCERSGLPCLADGIIKQGRRSWSFYVYHIYCLVDRRIRGQMLLMKNIVFSHSRPTSRQSKCKKTKAFGLAFPTYGLGSVGRYCSQRCPTNGPTATRQLVRQPFVFYLILLKKHGILFRTRVEIRYVNCRVMLVDEIVICFLTNLVQKNILSCPEFSYCLMQVWHY